MRPHSTPFLKNAIFLKLWFQTPIRARSFDSGSNNLLQSFLRRDIMDL